MDGILIHLYLHIPQDMGSYYNSQTFLNLDRISVKLWRIAYEPSFLSRLMICFIKSLTISFVEIRLKYN